MQNDFGIRLLRQINGLLTIYSNNQWEKISGLTFAQIFLLNEIFAMSESRHSRISSSDLSAETGFSKATVCSTLKALKKKGYIEMNTDRTDNRRKKITLTQKAYDAESDLSHFIQEVNDTLCNGISDQDLKVMELSLQKVLENIRKTKAEAKSDKRNHLL